MWKQEKLAAEAVDDSQEIIRVLSAMMEGMLAESDECGPPQGLSLFTGNGIPDIEIEEYLLRLRKHCKFSCECPVIALIYIDRFMSQHQQSAISVYNVHRYGISIMLASKYHDDLYFNNKTFAFAGGVSPKELNELQLCFLVDIGFNLFIDSDVYREYRAGLSK